MIQDASHRTPTFEEQHHESDGNETRCDRHWRLARHRRGDRGEGRCRARRIVEAELGRVDALVNNAGVLKTVPLADTSDALYDQTFDIVRGTFNTLREAAARMNAGGRIVNFSSTMLALNMPGYAIYNATKAVVEAFTHVFAKELRGRGIKVNAIAPGPVATSLFLDGKSDEQIAAFSKMPPLERLGQPDDIASVVAFLVGPDAGWINGQVLRANGGVA